MCLGIQSGLGQESGLLNGEKVGRGYQFRNKIEQFRYSVLISANFYNQKIGRGYQFRNEIEQFRYSVLISANFYNQKIGQDILFPER